MLDHAVQNMYYSRPELVPDDKGRVLPVMTDEYLSVALLDSVNNSMKGIATWKYIGRLLAMVEGSTDKVKRPLILQELTNVCHMEYRRAQGMFWLPRSSDARQTRMIIRNGGLR